MMRIQGVVAPPSTWKDAEVYEVGTVITGNTPPKRDSLNYGEYIPFVKPPQLLNTTVDQSADNLSALGAEKARIAPPFSILVSCIGTLGKTGFNRIPIAFNQQINAIVPSRGIEPRFLFYQTQSNFFRQQLEDFSSATTIPIINKGKFEHLILKIAPLNEQNRIVVKIDELFSELDKGVESLKTARAQLKVYRQAVLKHAFEGKLTAQWREENKDKLETAEQLLSRVRRERVARDQRQLRDWKTAINVWNEQGKPGNRPSKPRKAANLRLDPDALAMLPPLPVGHAYTFLANLGQLGRGKSKHRPRNAPALFGGPYPFIQTAEVKAAGRVIREYTQTYSEIGLGQSMLWPQGTLCITIAANIAETAFLGFDGCFPDSVVGLTADENLVLPEYVELFIKSVRTRIEAYAPATAQKNINLTTLESLVVPLCSVAEQRVLVDRLQAILTVIDGHRAKIDTQLRRADALRQSILKKAFSGQLVEQDPNEESATVLLERIKAKRASQKPKARTRQRKVVNA